MSPNVVLHLHLILQANRGLKINILPVKAHNLSISYKMFKKRELQRNGFFLLLLSVLPPLYLLSAPFTDCSVGMGFNYIYIYSIHGELIHSDHV